MPCGLAALGHAGVFAAGSAAAALVAATYEGALAAADAAWALSTGHGVYAAQHAYMQRVSLDALPAEHPMRRVLDAALSGCSQVWILSRCSDEEHHGGEQGCAGAAGSGSLAIGSVKRQEGFLAALLRWALLLTLHSQ